MLDGIREQLEQQVARLLEEAEKPMRAEEILPHLDPLLPTPNDIADVLQKLAADKSVKREGSFYAKPAAVPVEHVFQGAPPGAIDEARAVVETLRALDEESGGEGASFAAIVRAAGKRGVPRDRVLDIVTRLKQTGEVFSFRKDRLRLAKA